MKIPDPFHAGEVEVQELLGERNTALLNGRLYEDSVIGPAHKFLAQLPFFILSTVDGNGLLPITVVYGPPGFMTVDATGKFLKLSLSSHKNQHVDPVLRSLVPGSKVGGLAIDLATRRRLRVNGLVLTSSQDEVTIEVVESYPNCPKYIQKRIVEIQVRALAEPSMPTASGDRLEPTHLDLIRRADTFFVSSANPTGNVDASHRGGNPGFIKVLPSGELRIPDYPGNSLYNTFGNFKVNSAAGLVFWDFEAARLLHVFGDVGFDFSAASDDQETGGTGRWWIFTPRSWVSGPIEGAPSFSVPEFSPSNPIT